MAVSFQRPSPASSMRPPPTAASSSQVPASAPVLEFRCMFTHDVLKKQKKWHDGVAKYHTFNKKVMVYDDSKNLVGGVHYRDPEEFGEGLEIKLDRPVLVQVEDQLGESTTDLTPLINRPSPNNASSNNIQTMRPPISRILGANSQIKPKSIKELLAGSQGQIGRARLPVQSPFEQRHVLNEIQTNSRFPALQEHPAKRRRLSGTGTTDVQRVDQASVRQRPVMDPVRPQISSKARDQTAREVMNISSDDEPVEPVHKAQTLKPKAKPTKSRKDAKPKQRRKPSLSQDDLPRPMKTTTHQKVGPSVRSTSELTRPVSASSARDMSLSNTSDRGPRSSLKFSSQKPRPKLMYKALLTGTPAFSENANTPESEHRNNHIDRSTRAPARQVQNNLLETDRFFESSQVRPTTTPILQTIQSEKGREPVQEQPSATRSEQTDDVAHESLSVPHSPLFLSQPDVFPTQGLNHKDDLDDPDLFLDEIQKIPDSSPTSDGIAQMNDAPELDATERVEESEVLPSSPASAPSPMLGISTSPHNAHEAKLRKPLPNLALSSPVESRSTPMQRSKRDFRRVFSESTAVDHKRGLQSDDDDFSDDETLLNIAHRKADESGLPRGSNDAMDSVQPLVQNVVEPANLSDIGTEDTETMVTSRSIGIAPQDSETAHPVAKKSIETGPWTTRESFLLFDWWPPKRSKPDYGQGADTGSASTNLMIHDDYEDVSTSIASRGMSKKYGVFGSARFVSQR